MIVIVDYEAGNLTSVAAAAAAAGFPARISSDPADIATAERLIFPGVGAAASAMHHLRRLGLVEPLRAAVASGKPFLGICLGFQILFEHSDEDGGVDLLGLFRGRVVRFPDGMTEGGQGPLKVPHMGWSRVEFTRSMPLGEGLPADSEFYFVHSYYPEPEPSAVCATAVYGRRFAAGVARGNVIGFQFHPEKSGRPGLQLLRNFCTWTTA
ncbi:MAG: imidazole glycerol phosphate synthase subunit HisH [Lentisphaerae bacterium]|nr:imidazole glycerol phosphate synthase subunit HisH [Lentisphaerota bacterium]